MRTLRSLPKSYLVRRHLGGLGVSLSVGKHIKWGRPTQVVQAYTVQAQAYLYNTYTSNLYKHICKHVKYNLSYFAQVVQAHTSCTTICFASTSTYCANNLSRKLCNTIFLSLATSGSVQHIWQQQQWWWQRWNKKQFAAENAISLLPSYDGTAIKSLQY